MHSIISSLDPTFGRQPGTKRPWNGGHEASRRSLRRGAMHDLDIGVLALRIYGAKRTHLTNHQYLIRELLRESEDRVSQRPVCCKGQSFCAILDIHLDRMASTLLFLRLLL